MYSADAFQLKGLVRLGDDAELQAMVETVESLMATMHGAPAAEFPSGYSENEQGYFFMKLHQMEDET